MPQFWSLEELHETATALYEQASQEKGTQKLVVETINDNREQIGLDRVTRQAVQKAVRDGGRSNMRLLCDIVDALWPQMQTVKRDGVQPVLHVEVSDPQNRTES